MNSHSHLRRIAWAIVCLLAITGAACGGDSPVGGNDDDGPGAATSLTLSSSSLVLTFLGQTAALTGRLTDASGRSVGGSVSWTSDDASIATVTEAGVVTAVANGSTTVRAAAGSLTAAASVNVQQEATAVVVVSGDGQSGPASQALPEPVVVRATDEGGSPAEGVDIVFSSVPGGSFDPDNATTGSDGSVTSTWTLGTVEGPQLGSAAVASTPAVSVLLTAQITSADPTPDLVGTVLVLDRGDPSSLEPLQVTTTIRNSGSGDSGTFPVRLLVDGVETLSREIADIAAGSNTTVTLDLAPLTAGTHTLTLEIDAGDTVAELNESNNSVLRVVSVVQQTEVSIGSPLAGIGGAQNSEQLFRFTLPEGSTGALTVALAGGTGDVDLFVQAGDRPSNRAQYVSCLSGGPTTAETCAINNAAPGHYHVLLHAFAAFEGTTMTVTSGGEVAPYDIELVFVDRGTPEQDAVVEAAAARWMELVTADVSDVDFSTQPVAADACITGQPAVSDVVDDLRIYVRIVEIDGNGRTLARAGPCITRGLTDLPAIGTMEFDQADLFTLAQAGDMLPVVLHEMGHVLGIGTIWSNRGLLKNPSLPSNTGADTHFSGALAIEAFDAAGGQSYTGGAKVPVENQAGAGSSDSHWRENPLGLELMTPFFQSGQSNPLSAISVQSLADVGYTVDPSKADGFSGTFPLSSLRGFGGPIIDLRGDVRIGPRFQVDERGRLTPVSPAGGR